MKYFILALTFIIALILPGEALAQRHGSPERGPGKGGGRFNEFRKMKLIETLKLSEEDAARFVTKESVHEDSVRSLMTRRNDLLDDIRKDLKEKKDVKEFQSSVNDVMDLDQQIFKERQRYQEEMRKFLAPEKFARFLVFEREFGRGVGDVLRNMVKEHLHERED